MDAKGFGVCFDFHVYTNTPQSKNGAIDSYFFRGSYTCLFE